jgi:hypothetical protein
MRSSKVVSVMYVHCRAPISTLSIFQKDLLTSVREQKHNSLLLCKNYFSYEKNNFFIRIYVKQQRVRSYKVSLSEIKHINT